MLTFKDIKLNQKNLCKYLRSHKDEIEMTLRSNQFSRLRSIDEILKIDDRVVVTGTVLNDDGSLKHVDILSINCNSTDISSTRDSEASIVLSEYIILDLRELFNYKIIDAKNLVYVVSDDSWFASYYLFGVFSNFETARIVAKNNQADISAFYMNKETSVYISGYKE